MPVTCGQMERGESIKRVYITCYLSEKWWCKFTLLSPLGATKIILSFKISLPKRGNFFLQLLQIEERRPLLELKGQLKYLPWWAIDRQKGLKMYIAIVLLRSTGIWKKQWKNCLQPSQRKLKRQTELKQKLGELPMIDRWMCISSNHYESLVMELDWLIQVS